VRRTRRCFVRSSEMPNAGSCATRDARSCGTNACCSSCCSCTSPIDQVAWNTEVLSTMSGAALRRASHCRVTSAAFWAAVMPPSGMCCRANVVRCAVVMRNHAPQDVFDGSWDETVSGCPVAGSVRGAIVGRRTAGVVVRGVVPPPVGAGSGCSPIPAKALPAMIPTPTPTAPATILAMRAILDAFEAGVFFAMMARSYHASAA